MLVVRRVGQPLDDQARRDDRPRRQGHPGRRRAARDRRATAPPTSRSSPTPTRPRPGAAATRWRARSHANQASARPRLAAQIAAGAWRDDPYEDASTDEWIDPRTISIALNDLLPNDRAVAVDSGHFLGYPSMFLDVPDARAWLFPNGFQAVGLGLGNAIGAAIAEPDRPDGRGDRRRRRVHGAGRARDGGAAEARRCSS